MADETKRDKYQRQVSAMREERQSFISHYQELAQFIQPRRGRFLITDRNKGDRRYNNIINSRATQAHRVARSGMLAGIMSPARPWVRFSTFDADLMEFGPVKNWLYKAETIQREIFNQSNLYNMAPVMLGELLLFGTGAMSHVDDFDDVARFYTHTAGSYMIAQDNNYRVRTFAHEFEMTVKQMVDEFGKDKCSQFVRDQYDKSNYNAWYPVTQFIQANDDYRESSKLSKYKAFSSCYYEPGNNDKDQFLREKGFEEFPVYCPRWDVTGEDIYGTDCPAMTSLGDIKSLQVEEKRKAQAIDKMVNPPLHGPASAKNVSALPGGYTGFDGDPSSQGIRPIYMVSPQVQELMADIQATERRIETSFFVDLFLAISTMEGIQPRNQFDLMQRNEERLLQLGPVLERMHGEFLAPLVDRTFNQMVRANLLPPAPPELEGKELKVNFISTLAMAQRAVAVGGIDRLAAFVGGLAKAGFAQTLDKFDADQAVDEYANAIGVPPTIVVPDDAVAQIRADRAQQQQQEQAMQMAQQGANTAKMLSDAKTDGKNALTDLTGGA